MIRSDRQDTMAPVSETGKNLVFVFGLPRSGTTLLSLILGSHPAVLAPPEPWFLLKLNLLRSEGRFDGLLDDYQLTQGTREFLPDDIFQASFRAFAATAYNAHLNNCGKRIFVDKTPRYYHLINQIDDFFPDAKKVWLKRNPLDVAASFKTTWNFSIDHLIKRSSVSLSCDLLEGPFKLARYFSSHDPSKIEIQYEELTAYPQKTAASLCEFLGLLYDPQMIRYWENRKDLTIHRAAAMGDKKACGAETIYPSSVGNWKEHLALEEIRSLMEHLGSGIFLRMGYEPTLDWLAAHGVVPKASPPRERCGSSTPAAAMGEVEVSLQQELIRAVNNRDFSRSVYILGQLLREFSTEESRRFQAIDAFILTQLQQLKRTSEQLSYLMPLDQAYLNRRAEAKILAAAGQLDMALERLHTLYREEPEKRSEVLNDIIAVLDDMNPGEHPSVPPLLETLSRYFVSE